MRFTMPPTLEVPPPCQSPTSPPTGGRSLVRPPHLLCLRLVAEGVRVNGEPRAATVLPVQHERREAWRVVRVPGGRGGRWKGREVQGAALHMNRWNTCAHQVTSGRQPYLVQLCLHDATTQYPPAGKIEATKLAHSNGANKGTCDE